MLHSAISQGVRRASSLATDGNFKTLGIPNSDLVF